MRQMHRLVRSLCSSLIKYVPNIWRRCQKHFFLDQKQQKQALSSEILWNEHSVLIYTYFETWRVLRNDRGTASNMHKLNIDTDWTGQLGTDPGGPRAQWAPKSDPDASLPTIEWFSHLQYINNTTYLQVWSPVFNQNLSSLCILPHKLYTHLMNNAFFYLCVGLWTKDTVSKDPKI